ncbi:alpha/beta fold hydrolase [Streptomyces camelliae]|uniref:Alpha/beta hydrolase n=1 Tax=Streptomyces camelliae TaxID=3004093 RepID=A0ABY7NW90_9ACTN|nr:alpha/beta hydrolase [Streptomyces sp. HUAS 2-6]WBO62340.1 alpha/beta hydrolase [Streptomyces sp. HUAS 2-6]
MSAKILLPRLTKLPWLPWLLCAGLALAGCAGATAAPTGTPSPSSGTEFSGRVDIGGGRGLYLHCKGSGTPTVILESGLHESSDTWSVTDTKPPVPPRPSVFDGVASFTRVCAYDRPGTLRNTRKPTLTTRSTDVTGTRSLAGMSGDLDKLLKAAKVPGPYVLAGHSFGGMVIRLYAQQHPGQVAGLVFVDAFGADLKKLMGGDWQAYLKVLARPGTPFDHDPKFEQVDVDGAVTAVNGAKPLPHVPAAVLSKSEPFAAPSGTPKNVMDTVESVWPKAQDTLVGLEPQTPHLIATGSGHYIMIHDPDLTTSAIALVRDRALHGGGKSAPAGQ